MSDQRDDMESNQYVIAMVELAVAAKSAATAVKKMADVCDEHDRNRIREYRRRNDRRFAQANMTERRVIGKESK